MILHELETEVMPREYDTGPHILKLCAIFCLRDYFLPGQLQHPSGWPS